ncbi:MAG: metallophosphoesterase [Clostridia bacterium]|nr:metallophosphoesterase [Clostridia bacterium]
MQDANDKNKDIESLTYMFEKLKEIKCPCYSILGNHDLKMMDSVKEVEEIMGYDSSTYSVDAEGFHLVFLTTEIRPELGLARGGCYKAHYLSEQSIAWLKSDLENNQLPCLIFTHYALADDDEINDECMFMKNRADVKEIIKNNKNILAVFSGHTHRTKRYVEDGVIYYVLGSLIGCHEANGVPDGVYFEVDLKDGKINVTEHHIEI